MLSQLLEHTDDELRIFSQILPEEVVRDKKLFKMVMDASKSTPHFCKFYYPDTFDRPFTDQHEEIFDALDDPRKQRVLIMAPRGIGKSTVLKGFIARNIAHKLRRYIVPIGSSEAKIIEKTEDIKSKLRSSKELAHFWGRLHGGKLIPDRTSTKEWITTSGIKVWPRGHGQEVRGALFGDIRPDLVFIDDLEKSKHIKNPEWRHDVWTRLNTDYLMSIDRAAQDYKIIVIGTILHHDSLLVKLEEASKREGSPWTVIRFDLCEDDGISLWPSFMTTEQIVEEREEYRANGIINQWYMECRNQPAPPDEDFQQKMFQYWDIGDSALTLQDFQTDPDNFPFVLCDPARTTGEISNKTAIVGGVVNFIKNKAYQLEEINDRLDPAETTNEIIAMCLRLRAPVCGVEVTGLGLYATQGLKNEIARRGLGIKVVELHAPGGRNAPTKEDRVRQLLNYYRPGMVLHNSRCCSALEEQLLTFPRPREWDVMDAWSYLIELFERAERWMVPDRLILANDEKTLKRLKDQEQGIRRGHPAYGGGDSRDDFRGSMHEVYSRAGSRRKVSPWEDFN